MITLSRIVFVEIGAENVIIEVVDVKSNLSIQIITEPKGEHVMNHHEILDKAGVIWFYIGLPSGLASIIILGLIE